MNKFLTLLSIIILSGSYIFAQTSPVANYTFSQSEGTYTEISGGTVHGTEANDDESFNAIDLGFTFNYNGVDYTQASIQANGYIAMGATVNQITNPISNTGGSNNVISPLGSNYIGQTGAELMSKTDGVPPNRVFTVQWKNYKHILDFNHSINFQVKLYETSNKIEFVYGNFSYPEIDDFKCQIGLRGNSNDDYNNRDNLFYEGAIQNDDGSYCHMNNSIKGESKYQYCIIVPNKQPSTGLTFTYEEPYSYDVGIITDLKNQC